MATEYNQEYEKALQYGLNDYFGQGEGNDPNRPKPLPSQSTPTQRKLDAAATPKKRANGLAMLPPESLQDKMNRLKQQRLDTTFGENRANAGNLPNRDDAKEQEMQADAQMKDPTIPVNVNTTGSNVGKSPLATFNGSKYTSSASKDPLKASTAATQLHHYSDAQGNARTVNVSGFSDAQKGQLNAKMKQGGHTFGGETSGTASDHQGGKVGREGNVPATQVHYTNPGRDGTGKGSAPVTVNYNNHTQDEIVAHNKEMMGKGFLPGSRVHSYPTGAPKTQQPSPASPPKPLAPPKVTAPLPVAKRLPTPPVAQRFTPTPVTPVPGTQLARRPVSPVAPKPLLGNAPVGNGKPLLPNVPPVKPLASKPLAPPKKVI